MFFKNDRELTADQSLLTVGGNRTVGFDCSRGLDALFGEERPSNMMILSFLLVISLHAWAFSRFLQNDEVTTAAVPLMMEVSMVTVQTPKPVVAPPKPTPPPPEKKPEPKKTPPKPLPKKEPQIVQKAPDFAPVEKVEEQPPVQQTAPVETSSPVTSNQPPPAKVETFTEANYRANYAHNPKPEYPAIAKNRNWQGKVMLRVQVTADGLTDSLSVDQSSGHEILDEAAMDAVRKWRFIPAKRGDTPVASSVLVPIVFTLRD